MDREYSENSVKKPLSKFIDCIWFSEQEVDQVYKIIPDNTIELIFSTSPILRTKNGDSRSIKLESHLAGLKTIPQEIEIKSGRIMGVRFKPEGIFPFIKNDVSQMVNESIDLELLFGNEIKSLEQQVLDLMSYDANETQLLELIESHFLNRFQSIECDDIIEEVIRRIHLTMGNLSVSSIAHQMGCSVKTIERRFKHKVGLAPKAYCRLYRFHRSILEMGSPTEKLSDIAYDCGYFDQTHYIKDVKRYAGMTPKEMFSQKMGLQRPTLNQFK